jgi:hypothetical protein
LRVVEDLACGDAEQHVLRLRVLRAHVVDVVRADQRQPLLAGDRGQLDVELRLGHAVVGRDPLLLQFDEEVALPEYAGVCLGPLARLTELAVLHRLAHDARHAGARADEAPAVVTQEVLVDQRAVVVAGHPRVGNDRHQIAVALEVLGEQQQVVDLRLAVASQARAEREVDLAAEDGFDAGFVRRPVELDRPVHVAVVGQCEGGHLEFLGARDELVDLGRAIQEGVFGVGVQVDE